MRRHTFRAEQDITISAFESGTEIDLKMVVTFNVQPGSPATQIDPEESPFAEVDRVRFFMVKDGNTCADEVEMPDWLFSRLIDPTEFHNWLMSEASEQAEADRDEAADAAREQRRDDAAHFGERA